MAVIKPFAGIRPKTKFVERIAALPYDVYNREEALEEIKKEPLSFLRIDRPETQFDNTVDTYDSRVYEKAASILNTMIAEEYFIKEEQACYYVYELEMNGRAQTGIVACGSIDDYENNVIKKHENTREDKEKDRIRHVDTCSAQTGPIFLAYRSQKEINEITDKVKKREALYHFTAPDGVIHSIWKIDKAEEKEKIEKAFADIDQIYIADGHHRAASAVNVGKMRRERKGNPSGEEEFNYFLSVLFPDEELAILPYHRVIKDLNGLTKTEFLEKLEQDFLVETLGNHPLLPEKKGEFGLYLEKEWYRLIAKPNILSLDPVKGLDVSILQDYVFSRLLGIEDPRTDKRIDFIGGIRGLKELEKRAGEDMKAAFSLYPTSIEELFQVSDAGRLMPPKSTWFEPKLRSGIFIHPIGE